MEYRKLLSITLLLFFLSGCSSILFAPKEHPLLETDENRLMPYLTKITLIATSADRRVVLINKDDQTFCAEPSPDVAESIISALKSSGALSVKDGSQQIAEAELKLQLAKDVNSSINQLFTRTQGLQVIRDGWFSLCQAQMNKIISSAEYLKKFDAVLKAGADLIKFEFDYKKAIATQEAQVRKKQVSVVVE